MSEDLISFKFGENWQHSKRWFWISLFLLLAILILGTYIRTTNINGLKDVTTGQYTLGPDLDPFLYLRIAHEIIDTGGQPSVDNMRYLGLAEPYYNFVPWAIVYLYKFLNIFSDVSVEYAAIIFPVIFFGLSIIVYFFFIREVFYKKEEFQRSLIAVLATAIYAVVPLMQHRTTAGIPELESAGLFFFWLSFFFFLKSWHTQKNIKSHILALAAGLSTTLMIFTWGGFRFIFYSICLATIICFFIGKIGRKETINYSLWFIPAFLFSIIKSGFVVAALDVTYAAIPFFVFIVLLVNLFAGELIERKARHIFKKQWITKEIATFVLVILVGIIGLLILKPGLLIGILGALKERLLYPFGRARTGLTVAENQQLYLTDVFAQFGKGFFWMFFFGLILLFYETVKNLEKKDKQILIPSFIIFLVGFTFSRYSPASTIFNGVNFISQLTYFGSLLVFIIALAVVYIRHHRKVEGRFEKFKEIEFSYLFLICLIILMIVASRGATRLLVISSPVFVIAMAFLSVALIDWRMKAKDDLLKLFLIIVLLASIIYAGVIFKQYETATANGVKFTIPNQYTVQWQNAMAWVRGNTAPGSIFIHWWDYGYWVQTMGQRPTVTDGGHAIGFWDHLTGRYLLTTPKPETALSLMKTYNVSYLLIDSTDLGKYSAYSIIGSDTKGQDRFSQIPVLAFNPSQSRENAEGEMRVYQGATFVDEDITYQTNNGSVFLPYGNSFFGGAVVVVKRSNTSISFEQPLGVFVYNQKQVTIPIRYLQYEDQFIDFGGGLEATVKIIPSVSPNAQGVIQMDKLGALIYLSPKVSEGLFAQLYVLNDPLKKYPTIVLAHSEPDVIVTDLNRQGAGIDEFVYYNGFRGPLKIWKVGYPSNIIAREEFLRTSGEYAEFDNLTFTK